MSPYLIYCSWSTLLEWHGLEKLDMNVRSAATPVINQGTPVGSLNPEEAKTEPSNTKCGEPQINQLILLKSNNSQSLRFTRFMKVSSIIVHMNKYIIWKKARLFLHLILSLVPLWSSSKAPSLMLHYYQYTNTNILGNERAALLYGPDYFSDPDAKVPLNLQKWTLNLPKWPLNLPNTFISWRMLFRSSYF